MNNYSPKRKDSVGTQYRINLVRAIIRARGETLKKGYKPVTLHLSPKDLVELSCGLWLDAGNEEESLPDVSQYMNMDVNLEPKRKPGAVFVGGTRPKER